LGQSLPLVTASASSHLGGNVAANALDGNPTTVWSSEGYSIDEGGDDPAPWIAFLFDDMYSMEEMHVWLTNLGWDSDMRCIKDVDVYASTDGTTFPTLVGNYTFDYNATDQVISLGNVPAQALQFVVKTNQWGAVFPLAARSDWHHVQDLAYLADVQFYGVAIPEPTTLGLLAIGSLGLLRRRKFGRDASGA